MAERVPELEDYQLEEIIQNGVGPMPAQGLTDQELVDLIAFLRQEYPSE
jgi:mono/diheme cytochrome c family protein